MIKKIIKSKIKSTTGAAIAVGAASLVSRFIGLARDKIFAHQFGAGNTLDAYFAAFRVPDLVYNMLVVGALSAGFIPVFKELLEDDTDEAWKVTNGVLNILGISLIVICTILFIFTPQLMQWVVPGYSGKKLDLTIKMTRVMFLSPILLGLSSIASGVLQSFKSFIVYSFTPVVYNLGIIAGALFFVPHFGEIGLAWGVILGAFLHLAIQVPTLFHLGFEYKFVLPWHNPHLKKIGKMMIPRTLGLAANQMNFLIMTILASTLAAGSLTIFNFAKNIQYFPVGIIGYSFALASFPALSELIAKEKAEDMTELLVSTIRKVLFLIIPITILFILLRVEIVEVVFGSGKFDRQSITQTASALAFFSVSLFAQSLIPVLVRGFFALKDTWSPFVVATIGMIINLVAALLLKDSFGISGLAMAFSISMICQFALLWLLLRNKLGSIRESKLLKLIAKITPASIFMWLTMYLVEPYLNRLTNFEGMILTFFYGLILGGLGLMVYILISYLLKTKELQQLQSSAKRKYLSWTDIEAEVDEPDEI